MANKKALGTKSAVATASYTVTLTFALLEQVTPDIFAEKVASACAAHGTLREDEGVVLPSDSFFMLKIQRVK